MRTMFLDNVQGRIKTKDVSVTLTESSRQWGWEGMARVLRMDLSLEGDFHWRHTAEILKKEIFCNIFGR